MTGDGGPSFDRGGSRASRRAHLLAGCSLTLVLVSGLFMVPVSAQSGDHGSQGPPAGEPGTRGEAKGRGNGRGPKNATTATTTTSTTVTNPAPTPPVPTTVHVWTTGPSVSTTAPAPVATPAPAAAGAAVPEQQTEAAVEVAGVQIGQELDQALVETPAAVRFRGYRGPRSTVDRAPVLPETGPATRPSAAALGWSGDLPVFGPARATIAPATGLGAVTAQPQLWTAVGVGIFGCLVGLLAFSRHPVHSRTGTGSGDPAL